MLEDLKNFGRDIRENFEELSIVGKYAALILCFATGTLLYKNVVNLNVSKEDNVSKCLEYVCRQNDEPVHCEKLEDDIEVCFWNLDRKLWEEEIGIEMITSKKNPREVLFYKKGWENEIRRRSYDLSKAEKLTPEQQSYADRIAVDGVYRKCAEEKD